MAFFDPFGGAGSGGSGGGSGAPGKDGRGISSIVFVSSTGGSIAGIAGATDTYKINYTDGTTSTYVIKNGNNGEQGPKGDTGKPGKDGKSIKSITKDDNNNLIVTFTDHTTQNIGNLVMNVYADFLTSEGFGNLRYYNGHFQCFDKNTSTWIDTTATPENVYILNMLPKSMKNIKGALDLNTGLNKLIFEEPDDTVLDGQLVCVIDKVIIRKKLGSAPIDETDGELLIEVKRKDFGSHKKYWFVDETFTPSIGDVWYYKAFPISTTGYVNKAASNETKIKCFDISGPEIYGFEIDQRESDPASMIRYLDDCYNAEYSPAYMDYENDSFNYGDWLDAWFIKNLKPVIMHPNGSIICELDPDNYEKTIDGAEVDLLNTQGFVMIGIPKVYYKCIHDGDITRYYFSNEKLDDNYVCWSHINAIGKEIDYCYISAYSVNYSGSELRCHSGTNGTSRLSASSLRDKLLSIETEYHTGHQWDGFVFSDYCLLTLLLMLIGKSTDMQTTFGKGAGKSARQNGLENTTGLFYGDNTNTHLKIFGIEHLWGDGDIVTSGAVNKQGKFTYKMTYGTQDGSGIEGYTYHGNGNISTAIDVPDSMGGYINEMYFSDRGIFPKSISGSSSTYFCDGYYGGYADANMLIFGGNSLNDTRCGMLMQCYHISNGEDSNTISKLSCKPL